jgi:hypothetical protein
MRLPAKSALPKTSTKPKRAEPPYPFILEALAPLDPLVRPMFSGYSVYVGDKIVCMLRDRSKALADNGLWLVFSETADVTSPALRHEFPSLREIGILGGKISHWLILPADGPDFESEALHACDLIVRHDSRLGRIPKSRQSKTSR